jgi:multidrug efflux pump subunit AcrA (membrane-fusion protein)
MKLLRFLIVILVMSMAACSSEGDRSEEKAEHPEKVTVKTELVREASLPTVRSFTGTVASADTALLTPKVTGYLDALYVKAGDTFKKGDLLARITSRELVDKKNYAESAVKEARNGEIQAALGRKMAASQLKQAEAGYALAEKTYRRFSNLLKTESVSKQEFDEVEAKYKAALEAVKLAQQNVKLAAEKLTQVRIKKQQAVAMLDEVKTYLGYTELRAPFDGVVLQKLMDIGNLAAPGQPVLKIGSHENVIYAYVNGSVIRNVKAGQEATVEIPSVSQTFSATVLDVDPNIDPATRNFRVKLSGNGDLVPGMYASVQLGEGSEETVVIPRSAVLERGELSLVFVDENSRAEMRIVKTGRSFKDTIEILSGLTPGEKIIVDKASELKSGDLLEE